MSDLATAPDERAVQDVQRFFTEYLSRLPDCDDHGVTLAFLHDRPGTLDVYIESLLDLPIATVFVFDTRSTSKMAVETWLGERDGYISVHNFATDHGGDAADRLREWVNENPKDGAYTVYEFPRVDLQDWQIHETLSRHFAGSPLDQLKICDRFFNLLERELPYSVDACTLGDSRLTVSGKEPWLVLAGPAEPGDIRFAPGCELFYNGKAIEGAFSGTAMNILPLGLDFPMETYEQCLELASALPMDPLVFTLVNGRVETFTSPLGQSEELWRRVARTHASFADVVEVGIGLSAAAGPSITTWAAPSNEAIKGVHIGFGADPGNFQRDGNLLHIDFVCEGALIHVNGEPLFQE